MFEKQTESNAGVRDNCKLRSASTQAYLLII